MFMGIWGPSNTYCAGTGIQFSILAIFTARLAHNVDLNNNIIENNRQNLTLGQFPEHHYVSITIEKEILTQIVGEISDAQEEFENVSPEVDVEKRQNIKSRNIFKKNILL